MFRRKLSLSLACCSLALMILAGCGGNSTTHPVGSTVTVGQSLSITISGFKRSNGDALFKPDPGSTFVITDVTIKNVAKTAITLDSATQFALKDQSGQQYIETAISGATALNGTLAPGASLSGQIAYQVPADQHDFTITFAPADKTNAQTWTLHS